MARSRVLAAFVLALMVFAAFNVPQTSAQTSYTEKLTAYYAGSNALWFMTFGGVNGSSKLSGLESAPGLAWYNITAIKTTGWASDFQVFGPQGYNLLPVPSTPSQGLFLTVGSDSYGDAAQAAAALDSYFFSSFASLSNGSGVYAFYSPLDFNSLVPTKLLSFLPSGEGGFANAVVPSSFDTTGSPMVVLEGMKSGSSFDHSLVVGSIVSSALTSTNEPNFLGFFGSTPSFLQASNHSSSSSIQIHFLDGIINASAADGATVVTSTSSFSSSYSLTLAPGKKVTAINSTVVQAPVPLLATRAVTAGVLNTGENLSVTITLSNLSPTLGVRNITFTDSWWNGSGLFKFLGGNDSFTAASLGPEGSTPDVYRLQYTGTTTGSFVIPPSAVRYQYIVGGSTFNGVAHLNPIRLSLGADDAVVYAYVSPGGTFGEPVGSAQSLTINLVNVGNQPASSIEVAGQSVSGLAANGGTHPVNVNQTAAGLLGINITKSYTVTYQDTAGNHLNATTNLLSDIFSHTGMTLGYPTMTMSTGVSFLPGGVTNLTLSITTANIGGDNVSSVHASYPLPPSLGCGSVHGEGASCSNGVLSLDYPMLSLSTPMTASVQFNVTALRNFVLPPVEFSGRTSQGNLSLFSNAAAAPAGITMTKAFSPSQLFSGMTSLVAIRGLNAGPQPYYNFSIATSKDVFDSVSGSTTKSVSTLGSGENVAYSYNATISSQSGNMSSTAVSANFFYGGTAFSIVASGPKVSVYQPVGVAISTSPSSPIEGKDFTLNIQLNNPSGVPVTDVLLNVPIPSGITLSQLNNAQFADGTLTVSVASLAPYASVNSSSLASASSGTLIPFDKATLTFSYQGLTINGKLPSAGIAIGEDVTTRYLIPIAIILVALLATAYYVRRLAAPSVPGARR